MATSTKLQDFLGRWLGNATPGTTQATDFLGRAVGASNKDFLGRALTLDNPATWAASTPAALNSSIRLSGGALMTATVGGTTAATAPTPPAVGSTVVDGTVTWRRFK